MFLIKIVSAILIATNLVYGFAVDRLKLPATYDEERCPPGIEPCVPEIRENVPKPTRGSGLTTSFSNTTSENVARVPTTAVPRNHSAGGTHDIEANSPSDANEPGKGKSTGNEFQKKYHPCTIGIWVCRRKKRAIRSKSKRRIRQTAGRREFGFATLYPENQIV